MCGIPTEEVINTVKSGFGNILASIGIVILAGTIIGTIPVSYTHLDVYKRQLEQYAVYKKTTADEVLKILEEKNLTDFVYDMYDVYHTETLDNAFMDLDSLIETGKPAW